MSSYTDPKTMYSAAVDRGEMTLQQAERFGELRLKQRLAFEATFARAGDDAHVVVFAALDATAVELARIYGRDVAAQVLTHYATVAAGVPK